MTIRRLLITRLWGFSPHLPYNTSSRYVSLMSNTKYYSSNFITKESENILKIDKKVNENIKSSDKSKNGTGLKKQVASYSPVLLSKTFNIGNYKMYSTYNLHKLNYISKQSFTYRIRRFTNKDIRFFNNLTSQRFYVSDSSKKINLDDLLSQKDDELEKKKYLKKSTTKKDSVDLAVKNDLKDLELKIDLKDSEVKKDSEMKNVSSVVNSEDETKMKSKMCGLFKRKSKKSKSDSCDSPKKQPSAGPKKDSCDAAKKCDSCNLPKKPDSCDKSKKRVPCEKKPDPCEKKPDPCENKPDPCENKPAPCEKKYEPCENKSDPCEKKPDPCEKKSDTCEKKPSPCCDKLKKHNPSCDESKKPNPSCDKPKKHNPSCDKSNKPDPCCDKPKKPDPCSDKPKKRDSCDGPKKPDPSDCDAKQQKAMKVDDCPTLRGSKSWFSRKKPKSASKKTASCWPPKKIDCEPKKCEEVKKCDDCPNNNYLDELLNKKKCDESVKFQSSKTFSFEELCENKAKLKKKPGIMNYFSSLFGTKKRKYHHSSSLIGEQNYTKIRHVCVPTKRYFLHNRKHFRKIHTNNKTKTPIYTWISIPKFRFVSEKTGSSCREEIKPQICTHCNRMFDHCTSNTNENKNRDLVTKITVCDNDKKKKVEKDYNGRDMYDFEASLNVKGENSKQCNVDLTCLEEALADVIEKTSCIGKATGSKITYNYYLKHNALKERCSINSNTSDDCKTATMALKHINQKFIKKAPSFKKSNISKFSCCLNSSNINKQPVTETINKMHNSENMELFTNKKTESNTSSTTNKQPEKEKCDAYKLYTLMNGSPYKPEEVMKSISEFLARNTPQNQSYFNKLYNYFKNLVRFYNNGHATTTGVSMNVNNITYKKFQKSRSYCTKNNKKLTVKKTDSLYQIFINRKLFKTIINNRKFKPKVYTKEKPVEKSIIKSLDSTIINTIDNTISKSSSLDSNTISNTTSKSSALDSNIKKETPIIDLHELINNYQDIILKNPDNNDDHLYCRIVRKKISNKIEVCAIQYMNESELQALRNKNITTGGVDRMNPSKTNSNNISIQKMKIDKKTSSDVNEIKKNVDNLNVDDSKLNKKSPEQSSVFTDESNFLSNIRSLNESRGNDSEDALQLLNSIKLSTFNSQTIKFKQQVFVAKPATTPPNQYGGRSNIAPTINRTQQNLHTLLDYMYSVFKKSIDKDAIIQEQKHLDKDVISTEQQPGVNVKLASLPTDEEAIRASAKLPKNVEMSQQTPIQNLTPIEQQKQNELILSSNKQSLIENHTSVPIIEDQKPNDLLKLKESASKIIEHPTKLKGKQNELKSEEILSKNVGDLKHLGTKDTPTPKAEKQNVLIVRQKKSSTNMDVANHSKDIESKSGTNMDVVDHSKDIKSKSEAKVESDIDELTGINKIDHSKDIKNKPKKQIQSDINELKKLNKINHSKDIESRSEKQVHDDIDELIEIDKLNEQAINLPKSQESKNTDESKTKSVNDSKIQELKNVNDSNLFKNKSSTNEDDGHWVHGILKDMNGIESKFDNLDKPKSSISKQTDIKSTSTETQEKTEAKNNGKDYASPIKVSYLINNAIPKKNIDSKTQSLDTFVANDAAFPICQSCSNERDSHAKSQSCSNERESHAICQSCSNELDLLDAELPQSTLHVCSNESNNDMMRERCKITGDGKEEILNKKKSRSETLRSCTSDDLYFTFNKNPKCTPPKQETTIKDGCLKTFDPCKSSKNLSVVGATYTCNKNELKAEVKECNKTKSEEKKCNIAEGTSKTCCDDEDINKDDFCCLTKKYMIDKHNACCKRRK